MICFSQSIENAQYKNKEKISALEKDTINHSANPEINNDTNNFILEVDEHFDILLQAYASQKKVQGFKIQLYAGSRKMDALKMKADFMKKYVNQDSPTIIYQQPNFKVRVGNYRDRLEATKYLELYKIDFPSAFLVKDAIEIKN